MKKAIVLTYPDLDAEQQNLIRNADIFKIACNWHAPELKPDIRLTLDDEKTIKKCLEADNTPVISVNYNYPDKRIKRVSFLPDRNSSLPSCIDYLVTQGYTHILLIATNKITNNKPSSKGFADDNRDAIRQLQDCAYIYKYTDDADFDIPTMKIEEFIEMNLEDRILGIKEGEAPERLLKTLAFSEAYRYEIETIGYDNKSIENGILLDTILPLEVKQRILNGEVEIEHAGLKIRRLTGVVDTNTTQKEENATETALTYAEMKEFIKEHNIEVKSMKKAILEQAIKEFKENE